MFGKLMNNFYYGKSGKGDYQRDDLPRNRWQLFWEMLRIRLAGLFRLNLMTALAFVPLMYVLIVTSNALVSYLINLSNVLSDPAMAQEAEAMLVNNAQQIYSILFSGLLMAIPCILITGPVQAGLAYVTRNWARDEHAFVWSDFKDAVKDNWKQALAISAITSVVPLLMLVCWQFYGSMAQTNGMFFILPQVLTLVLGVVWFLALTFMYPMMVTYKMSFMTIIRNAVMLAVGRLPHVAGVRLAMLFMSIIAGLVIFFTPYMMYAILILAAYYLFIGNALARFVYASFTNAVFDRYINVRIQGAQVNRGLSTETDDEDEDEFTGEGEDKV